MPELIRKSQDGTREIFEPIVAQCSRASQYNAANPPERAKFSFQDIWAQDDSIIGTIYWQIPRNQPPPVIGNWYTVTLSINTGANGTKYHDIMLLEPPNDTEELRAAVVSYLDESEPEIARPTATQPGLSAPERPNAGIVVEGVVQGHLEKLAVDILIAEAQGIPGTFIDVMDIRCLRDKLFHELKQKPIQHQHYCYEHETSFQFGNTGYGHRLETDDGWCIQETGIIMDDIKEE